MSRELPRHINPALIQIGDKLAITRDLGNGITQTLTGRVAERVDNGATRTFRTAERGVLVAWEPNRPYPSVTLLDRIPSPQTPIQGLEAWVPEREIS